MSLANGSGIVLRRVRHLENDARLTLFLREEGKTLAVVKGGSRMTSKLKALQEPFSEADFQVYLPAHGIHARVTGGKLLRTHQNLRRDMGAFHTGARCCEAIDVLVPYRAPSPELYDVLRGTLRALDEGACAPVEWARYAGKLMNALGHGDFRHDILDAAGDAERDALESRLRDDEPEPGRGGLSDAALSRAAAIADEHLERILPWQLKSAALFS